jgi:serine/threonine-protein kinase
VADPVSPSATRFERAGSESVAAQLSAAPANAEPAVGPLPERYVIEAELGRGGMAIVYRARDLVRDRVIALKQLLVRADGAHARELSALFEREFHLLAQLSHPRVIEVFDYGLSDRGSYYTMELLDGGDLRELSPLPWQRACAIAYDVCSSLALLHSRRFIHRDVSPRNVRCTRDGSAKLIDFGAAVPMGVSAQIVGTPAFVSPEVVSRSLLDARADLFSLGATLYFALTGRLAYAAKDFSQLAESWACRFAPPSSLLPDIPVALDDLVMSLLSLDPALRPRSATTPYHRMRSKRVSSIDFVRSPRAAMSASESLA